MEDTDLSCPVCVRGKREAAFTKKGYGYYECGACRSISVYPAPPREEIAEYYRSHPRHEMLSRHSWDEIPLEQKHVLDDWRRLLRWAEAWSGRGPLLDIGCGTGDFLRYAGSLGWRELQGIEMAADAAERAKRVSGAVIRNSDFTATALAPDSFSAVMLWDILEHFGEMRPVLAEAFRLLKPGGTIMMGTVNRHGFSLRLRKQKALTVAPPEHLTFPTAAGLSAALTASGFTVKRSYSFSIYVKEWQEVFPVLRGKQPQGGNVRMETVVTRSRMLSVLMKTANFFLNAAGLGDELVFAAQKPGGR